MTGERNLPAGVTPGSATNPPQAKCPRCSWENTSAANNHDAAASLAKHQQRAHGGAR